MTAGPGGLGQEWREPDHPAVDGDVVAEGQPVTVFIKATEVILGVD
jgi:hypothetical protein